jgi:hypothetical protein
VCRYFVGPSAAGSSISRNIDAHHLLQYHPDAAATDAPIFIRGRMRETILREEAPGTCALLLELACLVDPKLCKRTFEV